MVVGPGSMPVGSVNSLGIVFIDAFSKQEI